MRLGTIGIWSQRITLSKCRVKRSTARTNPLPLMKINMELLFGVSMTFAFAQFFLLSFFRQMFSFSVFTTHFTFLFPVFAVVCYFQS